MSEIVSNVSDTALWVATYRAMESERPDALFRDPFARRLAGERGESIVRSMPSGRAAAWPMIVRTKVFDEIIIRLIVEEHVDAVLNLAAGLDARAYRLPLPSQLRWLDVDFPEMMAYRAKGLADATPACAYEAVGLDLSDESGRVRLFDRVNAESKRVLVVSEGLLVYLTSEAVASLAKDLAARPNFAYWLFDIIKPSMLKMMNWFWGRRLSKGSARFQFGPDEGVRFFEPYGWRAAEFHANWDEAKRLNRVMRGAWMWELFLRLLPAATRERLKSSAATALLERPSMGQLR
jgi:methyltransferase (TIGR00027 family)